MSNQSTALRTEVGTRAFSAPEATPDDYEETFQYTNAVDMWSLGCVIYNVLAHSLPYANNRVKRFPFPTQPLKDRVSNQGINLLECLMRVDPSIRWTAEKAAKHPWLEESCKASSAAVKDATDDANSVVQPKGPNENQNRLHHSDSQIDMLTVISSMEKTRLRPADRTEAPIKHLPSQSSNRHEETSQVDSTSNSDGHSGTTLDMLILPSKYRISDSFVDTGTETLKPRRARHCRREGASHHMDEVDATKKPTASPLMPTISSNALKTLVTSYSNSSRLWDEGARWGDPLVKVHQSPERMELVTLLLNLIGEDRPEQDDIARAVELICGGVDLETRIGGRTALHLAVDFCLCDKRGQSTQILDQLLESGADVDARDAKGSTALQRATALGLIMKVFTASGPHSADHRLKQAIFLDTFRSIGVDTHTLFSVFQPAAENAIEVVRQLLRFKADVNAKLVSKADVDAEYLETSWTSLHCAALGSGEEYVDMLLGAGARVNEVNEDGWTALHVAAYTQDQNIAKKLILAGIDMNIVDNNGDTALDIARDTEASSVVEVIEEAQQKLRRQQRRERRSHRASHSPVVSPTIQPKQQVSTSPQPS